MLRMENKQLKCQIRDQEILIEELQLRTQRQASLRHQNPLGTISPSLQQQHPSNTISPRYENLTQLTTVLTGKQDTIEEEPANKFNQQVVIQSLKEDIIDSVNDLKSNQEVWNLTTK